MHLPWNLPNETPEAPRESIRFCTLSFEASGIELRPTRGFRASVIAAMSASARSRPHDRSKTAVIHHCFVKLFYDVFRCLPDIKAYWYRYGCCSLAFWCLWGRRPSASIKPWFACGDSKFVICLCKRIDLSFQGKLSASSLSRLRPSSSSSVLISAEASMFSKVISPYSAALTVPSEYARARRTTVFEASALVALEALLPAHIPRRISGRLLHGGVHLL